MALEVDEEILRITGLSKWRLGGNTVKCIFENTNFVYIYIK